jgi:hypothetical protein
MPAAGESLQQFGQGLRRGRTSLWARPRPKGARPPNAASTPCPSLRPARRRAIAAPAHAFGSKRQLLAALADYIIADWAARLTIASANMTGLDRLSTRVALYVDDASHEPGGCRAFNVILGRADGFCLNQARRLT